MKKASIYLLLIVISLFIACQNQSVKYDFITGLKAVGKGLSTDDVYLTNRYNQQLNKNSFVYGDEFYINFNNISGFTKEDELVYPGMEFFVVSQEGDTSLYSADLYEEYTTSGLNLNPLLLQASLTVAAPLKSNQSYTLHANIWDKKGQGTYTAKLDFDIKPNPHLKITQEGSAAFDEIYLFSKDRNYTIIDNIAKFNEDVYLIYEGLKGYKVEAESVVIGFSMLLKDADGNVLINKTDLFPESSLMAVQFEQRLSGNFKIPRQEIKNPVSCEFEVWDKLDGIRNSIKTKVEIEFK